MEQQENQDTVNDLPTPEWQSDDWQNYLTTLSGKLKPIELGKLFTLFQIHNKNWCIGTILNFEEFKAKLQLRPAEFERMLEFLDGANLVVNRVVIADKVPASLISRYQVVKI